MNRDEYIAEGRAAVPGWFSENDAVLFNAIDVAQRQAGVTGDLLEIGCYQGASAILLGYMRTGAERLTVCDLFDGATISTENEVERTRFYTDLSRQSFEQNYRRFHDDLPDIVAGPSSQLSAAGLDRTFRFIHVDGSHSYDVVRTDLLLCKRLLIPGGIVIFDDILTLHAPGVASAVWQGVLNDELVPLFQSRKFYGTWGAPLQISIPEELPTYEHQVLGYSMLHVEDAPSSKSTRANSHRDGVRLSDRERKLINSKRRIVDELRQLRRRDSSKSGG